MKQKHKPHLLFLLAVLFSNILSAQFTLDTITGIMMQNAPFTSGEYYVQTIYNDINHSSIWLHRFLRNELDLVEFADNQFERTGDKTFKVSYFYIKRYLPPELNRDDYKLFLECMMFSINGRYIVNKLEIWGNIEAVADLFFDYFPFGKKKEHGFYSLPKIITPIPDKITFSKEILKGKEIGRIEVVPFNNMTWEEYLKMHNLK